MEKIGPRLTASTRKNEKSTGLKVLVRRFSRPLTAAHDLEVLRGPAGKELSGSGKSQHWPQIEERGKFHAVMNRIRPQASDVASR